MRQWLSHGVLAAVSIGAAFALNEHQRPALASSYAEPEYVARAGTLSLQRATGEGSDIPLMTTHIVSQDIVRVGRFYKLRELLIRAAAPSQEAPSLELYVDVSRVAVAADGAHDPQLLLQTELPVMPRGRFGSRSSLVTLSDGTSRHIVSGTLMLTEIARAESGAYQGRGRLELQVEANGSIELITARFDGVLSWDHATGA
jgi:hypothetical protein